MVPAKLPAMTQNTIPADMPFETAMSELEKIVQSLESGKSGLEESIQLYERGVELRKHCESKLKDAQLRVEKLSLDAAGTPQRENFATN